MAVKELTTESAISNKTQEQVTAVFYNGNKVAEIGSDEDGFYCLTTMQHAKWIAPRKDIEAKTIDEVLEALKSVISSKPAKVEKTPLGTWVRKA